MYLIDTVVLSELRKPQRDARLTAWVARQRTTDLFVSVITIGEIERGISRQRATDPDFAAALAAWLDRVLALYGEPVVPFDLQIARRWGQLILEHLSKELEIPERLSRQKERSLKQLMFVRGVNEAASRIGRDGKGKDGAVGYFVWLAAVQRRCCTLGSAVASSLCGGLTVQRNFRSFCVLLEEIRLFLTL